MDVEFVNKYIEILNNEIGGMKKTDIIKTTQNHILEKTVDDLNAKVATLTTQVAALTDKLNKKTVDARVSKTKTKKKSDGSRDGGDF